MTGDWIAFCDDDDVWRPTFLATLADRLPPDGRYGFTDFVFIEDGI